jgi:hypothetical protein
MGIYSVILSPVCYAMLVAFGGDPERGEPPQASRLVKNGQKDGNTDTAVCSDGLPSEGWHRIERPFRWGLLPPHRYFKGLSARI